MIVLYLVHDSIASKSYQEPNEFSELHGVQFFGAGQMDLSDTLSVIAIVISAVSATVAFRSAVQSDRFQKEQWRRDELEIRRDVLRRLSAYRFRLTEGRMGQDGEPFIALNEAWIVFAEYPEVKSALVRMHMELGKPGRLSENYVSLVRAMAGAARVPVSDLDDVMLDRPFVPPVNKTGGSVQSNG